jgi:hypothetical protein
VRQAAEETLQGVHRQDAVLGILNAGCSPEQMMGSNRTMDEDREIITVYGENYEMIKKHVLIPHEMLQLQHEVGTCQAWCPFCAGLAEDYLRGK